MKKRKITQEALNKYQIYLYEQEKSRRTIEKYMCDLEKLVEYAAGRCLDRTLVLEYKEYLKNERDYKTTSINSFLVAANQFFEFMEWHDLRVKTYRIQRETFMPEDKELTKEEYKKLVKTASEDGKSRIGLVIQTICTTGIRVSELSSITVQALKSGTASTYNKGKERKIMLPKKLQKCLLCYIHKYGIKKGPVFQTKKGKALDRTYIWREMKKLCRKAGVDEEKVFPHNLRHLFARTFYGLTHDVVKLADMMGHSNIETTRIYLKESYSEYRKLIEEMGLLVGI